MNLSFSLCSRCKKIANLRSNQLVCVSIENRIYGWVCEECRKYIEEKVEGIMNEIPIPAALQPYLIQTPPYCAACQLGFPYEAHADGCPEKNFLRS